MFNDDTMSQWGSEFPTKLSIQNRVQFFLQGNDKTCLASKAAFNGIHDTVKNYRYAEKLGSAFEAYLNGQGGKSAVEWGQALYDYAIDRDRLQDVVTTDASDGQAEKNFPHANSIDIIGSRELSKYEDDPYCEVFVSSRSIGPEPRETDGGQFLEG